MEVSGISSNRSISSPKSTSHPLRPSSMKSSIAASSPRVIKGSSAITNSASGSTDSHASLQHVIIPTTTTSITKSIDPSYSHFIDMLPVPVCLIDKEGFISYKNHSFSTSINSDIIYTKVNLNFLSLVDVKEQSRVFSAFLKAYGGTVVSLDRCLSRSAKTSSGRALMRPFDWTLTYDVALAVILITGRFLTEITNIYPTFITILPYRESSSSSAESPQDSPVESPSSIAVALNTIHFLQEYVKLPEEKTSLDDIVHSMQADADDLYTHLLHKEFLQGKLDISTEKYDLVALSNSIVRTFKTNPKHKHVDVTFQCKTASPLIVLADVRKLSAVVRGILMSVVNAHDSVSQVFISCSQQSSKAQIEIGIQDSALQLGSIFEEMISNSSVLSTEKSIVDLHTGSLANLPIGSELAGFIISFNRCIIQSDLNEMSTETRRRTYLIVDDSQLCRKVLIQRLRRYNIDIEEAVDGLDAVEKVRRMTREKGRLYELILMDNSMPNMTGPKATKRIREMGYTGVIYGVTGSALKVEGEDFERHGADRILAKPLVAADYDFIIEGAL